MAERALSAWERQRDRTWEIIQGETELRQTERLRAWGLALVGLAVMETRTKAGQLHSGAATSVSVLTRHLRSFGRRRSRGHLGSWSAEPRLCRAAPMCRSVRCPPVPDLLLAVASETIEALISESKLYRKNPTISTSGFPTMRRGMGIRSRTVQPVWSRRFLCRLLSELVCGRLVLRPSVSAARPTTWGESRDPPK